MLSDIPLFGRSYEIWCAAENVAKTLILLSREAAISLVRDYGVADDRFLGKQEICDEEKIRSYVVDLCEKVRRDQEKTMHKKQ